MRSCGIWIWTISSTFICHNTMAQRNLIDVPTSEIVEHKNFFFQEQAVITKGEVNTSTVFTYGLGRSFEIGLTLNQLDFKRSQGVEIHPETPEENPDFLINAQKSFDIKDWFKIGIGTRSGINAVKKNSDIRLVSFNFLNTKFDLAEDKYKLIAGLYYATEAYVSKGTNWGLMAGVEAALIKDKVSLVSDFHSGTSSISVINAGFEISLPKEWKIGISAQFPTPGSDNNNGAVLQLSKN